VLLIAAIGLSLGVHGWRARMPNYDLLTSINALKGQMTLVGRRPELRHFVELCREDYEEILKIRPWITDIPSVKYQLVGDCRREF